MSNRVIAAIVCGLIGGMATAAEQAAPLLKPGTPTGKPQSCLSLSQVRDVIQVDERTLLLRTGANRYFRSDLNASCPGLGRKSRWAIKQVSTTGLLCQGDLFTLFDPVFPSGGPTCSYGPFTPVNLPNGERP